MKIVFVGPSLGTVEGRTLDGVEFRAPAAQGDVMSALADGASVVGLIDGQFDYVAPVWHKELLYALKQGAFVYGASSMGALRAAECQAFGMQGIGQIFNDYASGRRVEDADVALLHAPKELGYVPLTVPIVNVDATLIKAAQTGLLQKAEIGRLHEAARRVHYKERTWKRLAGEGGVAWPRLRDMLERCFTDQKRIDALALLTVIGALSPAARATAPDWEFHATPLWRELYDKSVK